MNNSNNNSMLLFVQGITGINSERRKSCDKIKTPSKIKHKRHMIKSRSTSSVATVLHSSSDLHSMAILQSQPDLYGQSATDLNTIGKSPSHFSSALTANNSNSSLTSTGTHKADSKSLKLSTPPTTPLVVQSFNTRSISPHPKSSTSTAITTAKNDIPEKEKKRKELSSSRQKKFHRHFQQISKDEKVINYFSCALVSDILLQGHLYISENHFAFYSNVFGFVTKLVIPTASVIKISKEKTAKIIPNAVGVATSDERHVFGSFMSREAAFRLMCSVCPPLEPIEPIPKVVPDVEISEECCSIEDDSSCSISGNESPPSQIIDSGAATASDASQSVLRHRSISTSVGPISAIASISEASSTGDATDGILGDAKNIPTNAKVLAAPCASTPLKQSSANSSPAIKLATSTPGNTSHLASSAQTSPATATKSQLTSSSSQFKAFSERALLRLKFPTEFHIVYLGVFLSVILALFSGFLLYRILDIEAKTSLYNSNRSPIDFNWGTGNDADIFAEALRWQRELQTKSTEEAHSILNNNLEQIAKVRRSLETLSMLIHDRSSSSSASSTLDTGGGMDRDETD